MCSHKMDAQLYAKLKDLTEAHVKRNVDTFTGGSMDKLVIFKEFKRFSDKYSFYIFVSNYSRSS